MMTKYTGFKTLVNWDVYSDTYTTVEITVT